jgi:predicted Fe-S protein YdhL (DUF1289 family)
LGRGLCVGCERSGGAVMIIINWVSIKIQSQKAVSYNIGGIFADFICAFR